jgi:type 1 fimbriae regulatory protein FimB
VGPDYDSNRKHLTSREVERLLEASKGSRNEARDRCLLLLMFRHGFRVSEACRLKLDQVDTESRVLHVARLKRGLSTMHPLALGRTPPHPRLAVKERARMKPVGKMSFVSEQRKPPHRSTVNLLLQKYSTAASLPLRAHPHMLRHACGFALADQGADTRSSVFICDICDQSFALWWPEHCSHLITYLDDYGSLDTCCGPIGRGRARRRRRCRTRVAGCRRSGGDRRLYWTG